MTLDEFEIYKQANTVCTVPTKPKPNVHGFYDPNVPCTANCKNATGYSCVCSCAGKNHGIHA